MTPISNLMITKEAAEYLRLSSSTLNKLRLTGGGPVFVQLAGRAIRYRQSDLDEWVAASIATSTSTYPANNRAKRPPLPKAKQ